MKLEDVYYFSVKKKQHPPTFKLAEKVVLMSQISSSDAAEINRRVSVLGKSKNSEHIRQCTNFLAEAAAFSDLASKNLEPHWVAEKKNKRMPDIQYLESGMQIPVEVKHLNSPRAEHEALSTVGTYGGSVNNTYHIGLEKKISDFITDAKAKFLSFNSQVNGEESSSGTLYLYFSKSIDAGLLDGIEWEENMEDRVNRIAQPLAGNDIKLVLTDIDSLF